MGYSEADQKPIDNRLSPVKRRLLVGRGSGCGVGLESHTITHARTHTLNQTHTNTHTMLTAYIAINDIQRTFALLLQVGQLYLMIIKCSTWIKARIK